MQIDPPHVSPTLVPGSRRGKPGRPKKGDQGIFGTPKRGHNAGIVTQEQHARTGDHEGTVVQYTGAPLVRLLDLGGTARYLSISAWTVRDLEAAGIIRRVRVPRNKQNEDLNKILFDRNDLDALIDRWKDSA